MNKIEDFYKILLEMNTSKALEYIDGIVKCKKDLVNVYENLIKESLTLVGNDTVNGKISIFEEHIISGIVRTVIENQVGNISNFKSKANGMNAIVLCPSEEFHDLGARIVHDFLLLLGVKSHFIGANTPIDDFIEYHSRVKADFLVISVSNYFNLVELKKSIAKLKANNYKTKIIIGGSALNNNCHIDFGADYCTKTYDDFAKLVGDQNAGL